MEGDRFNRRGSRRLPVDLTFILQPGGTGTISKGIPRGARWNLFLAAGPQVLLTKDFHALDGRRKLG